MKSNSMRIVLGLTCVLSALQAETFFVEGNISDLDDPGIVVEGCEVIAFPGGQTTTTDAQGNYRLDLDEGWTGLIRPTTHEALAYPEQIAVTNLRENLSGLNFSWRPAFQISGHVSDESMDPMVGVEFVTSTGERTYSDPSGFYSFHLHRYWSGMITASHPGVFFSPPDRFYDFLTDDHPDQNYSGTPGNHTVAGWVRHPDGTGIPEVTVSFNPEGGSAITDASGRYLHTVIPGWSGEVMPTKPDYLFTPPGTDPGTISESIDPLNFTGELNRPQIATSTHILKYGATPTVNPDPQSVLIQNNAGGTLDWTINKNEGWLVCTPSFGLGSGVVTVSVDATGLDPGYYYDTIEVHDALANNSPQYVSTYLTVKQTGDPPFGSFDTPISGATVQNSIPVTGWALDDVGVSSVKIYRQEGATRPYIGDAVFVEGARPDVENAFPDYPQYQRAGWGYMLLTHFLPNGGNGAFTIEAIATDMEGTQVSLGTKTIYCDNANAVKPFGAIDTPAQGGTASGASFVNWGWALTPQPNSIPTDGSTINVWVDGIQLGHPTYNIYRSDIATLFPGYANSNGAAGYFYIDTTAYENGVHTIQWTATDTAGNTDGIGSRFFNIQNTERVVSRDSNQEWAEIRLDRTRLNFANHSQTLERTPPQLFLVTSLLSDPWTVSADQPWISVSPDSGQGAGLIRVTVNPDGLSSALRNGNITVTDTTRSSTVSLPVYLDTITSGAEPTGGISSPLSSTTVSGVVDISGWALDDLGVTQVLLHREEGPTSVLMGRAKFVETELGFLKLHYNDKPLSHRLNWVFRLDTLDLPNAGNGTFPLFATVVDVEGNETNIGTLDITCDNANSPLPFGDIDLPLPGAIASGSAFPCRGWVLTPPPNALDPEGFSIGIYLDGDFIGTPTYNIFREDIAMRFPDHLNSRGAEASFEFNTTEHENGVHTIGWFATDDAGNGAWICKRTFRIQNLQTIPRIEDLHAWRDSFPTPCHDSQASIQNYVQYINNGYTCYP